MERPEDSALVDRIFEHLQQTRGFDFGAYRRTSLTRRLRTRVRALTLTGFDEYLDYLQAHGEESAALRDAILINVTGFFRDADVWTYVSDRLLPGLIEGAGGRPLRIWSAGCAAGQEAYSLAMLLAERLGLDGVRERATVYATDVDEDALAEGRAALFTTSQVSAVRATLLDKYFTRCGEQYAIAPALRSVVVFGRHDLLHDEPISRVDLLVCRNTLMYFSPDAQSRLISAFHGALNSGGYLLLGDAEIVSTHSDLFCPVDLGRRVFRSVPQPAVHDPRAALAASGPERAAPVRAATGIFRTPPIDVREAALSASELRTARAELRSANEALEMSNEILASTVHALDKAHAELQSANEELASTNEELRALNDVVRARTPDLSAVVVLDHDLRVIVWNNRAADLFGVPSHDAYGAPFFSLALAAPLAGLHLPIRDVLDGRTGEHDVLLRPACQHAGHEHVCRVQLSPLRHPDASVSGVILLAD